MIRDYYFISAVVRIEKLTEEIRKEVACASVICF